jgi:hypothetical protein
MNEETAEMNQSSTAEQPTTDYSAFLGPPSAEADLTADERSAPDAEGEGEPELSGEAEGEPQQEEEAQAEQVEAETEQVEQPPAVQERLKDLTQREADRYAHRYPNAWQMLQNPRTPDDVKHLLLDKIDSDNEIARRIAQERAYAEQQEAEEPTLQYEEPQPVQATPEAANEQRAAYYNQIDNLVKTQFDQQAIHEVGDAMLRMFNVNVKALQDPNVSPEDKAVLQGLVASVQREAPILARFMTDAVATTVPHILPAAMEVAMPGFSQMYERQMYGNAYESVRQQTDERGQPLYANLPAYPAVRGTPEAAAFSQLLREAAEQIPGFDDMVFRDGQGRVLPEGQQAVMKYTLLARHLSGQRMNPAVVAQAVETGRRLAGRADQRRQTARATGAGQGTAGLPGRGASEEDDPLLAALDAEIARQEGNYRQVVRGRQSTR